MEYKVLNTFREKDHDSHLYEKGKKYPAKGYKTTKKRVEFLQQENEEFDGMIFLETPEEAGNKETEKKEAGEKSADKK